MQTKPIVAIMYDFDKTLSPKDMQEYAFIPGLKMEPTEFWEKCNSLLKEKRMDPILSYMYMMLNESRGKMLLNRDVFKKLGSHVQLFDGVKTWFKRVNDKGEKLGVTVEHYILSSGLKEIIEGTAIAHEFKEIYAAEFLYDDSNVPVWPSMAVNYTSKTQFLFRINKGVLDITENEALNEFTPENKRRVPFRNMIYIGDGLTDVPCMKLVKVNGGHSIAVYQEHADIANNMILQGRVDFVAPADYTKGSKLENIVFAVLENIKTASNIENMHIEDENSAKRWE